MKFGHNSKFFYCADIVVDCQMSHPGSDQVRTDHADGVLAFSDSLIGQRKSVVIECKQYPTASNPIAITGQQLAALENERVSLIKLLRWQRSELQIALDEVQSALVWVGPEPVEGTVAYRSQLRKKIAERFHAFLRTVYALKRVVNCLRVIRKIFFVEFVPFRGFSWSKRAWSLLHGSHPPKTPAIRAVFGCA